MFLEAVILGIIIGILRNGRITNLMEIKINGWIFVLFSFLCFAIPFGIKYFNFNFGKIEIFLLISMIFMLITILANINRPGMKIIFIGGLINILIVVFNGFAMPVSIEALTFSGLTGLADSILAGNSINYISMDNAVLFTGYLGKILPIPSAYPLAKVLSIGDILMTIGIVVFIQKEMLRTFSSKSGMMINYSYK